jgi:hypothetical protein
MNNRNWTPFILPATIGGEKTKALTIPEGSPSGENPSRYLQWKVIEANLPEGSNIGDLLYWNPSAGDNGAWVVLAAPSNGGSIIYWDGAAWQFLTPPSGTTLHVLGIQSGTLAWTATEDCD